VGSRECLAKVLANPVDDGISIDASSRKKQKGLSLSRPHLSSYCRGDADGTDHQIYASFLLEERKGEETGVCVCVCVCVCVRERERESGKARLRATSKKKIKVSDVLRKKNIKRRRKKRKESSKPYVAHFSLKRNFRNFFFESMLPQSDAPRLLSYLSPSR
jgi:hypothetical protein